MKGAKIKMEQELIKYQIEQDMNNLEVLRYNARFDSTDMLTVREVYRRLEEKKAIFLPYTAFYGYLIDFGVFVKCRLFGEETYCVADKYSELIKTKIYKDKATKKYYFIYLLTDEGLRWLVNLIEEMDIVNWETI